MTSLIRSDGTEATESNEIKEEVFGFYQSLYASREHIIEDFNFNEKLDNGTPKLTDQQAEEIEGLISFSEAGKTLRNMQNNRSPGSTGFTTEFF